MDHGTLDLFGPVPSSNSAKPKKNKTAVIKPAADPYFVVYAPGRQPFYVLSLSIFAFVLWYVFGAQLTDIMPFDMKELPGPIYGALTFLGLIVGCIWLCVDLFAASIAYFRSDPERRIYGRYRSKWRAYWLRISISLGCVSMILLASLLTLHGYWNARSVAIVICVKLLQPPKLAEEQVASSQAPPPDAASERRETFGPPPPIGQKLEPPIETGSIFPRPKKSFQKPVVKEVDPLSNSVKEICDWFKWNFGLSPR